MGDSLVKEGAHGILQRNQQLTATLAEPMTPDEIWRQAVQSRRGFESTPAGAADRYRLRPSSLPAGPWEAGRGSGVGKGFETYSGIQVLDGDGKRVAMGADHFTGGGADAHAEARVVRGLEKGVPDPVPGGRLVVVVDQDCCPSCEGRLREFAAKKGISEIEIHVPGREHLKKPGVLVSPKTAAKTSFMATGKPTTVRLLRTIRMPPWKAPPVPPRAPLVPSRARTAVVGSLAGLGAGIALGILQSKMKDGMLASLEKMPKPKVDRREAAVFFSDPDTGRSLRLLDLMARNLGPFGKELEEHHQEVLGSANGEVMLLALSTLPTEERVGFLEGLQEQLEAYAGDLETVRGNTEAAKALAPKALEAAEGAQSLAGMVETVLIMDWLVKAGFSIEEILAIRSNLRGYAARVRGVFRDVDALHVQVDRMGREVDSIASQVSKVRWGIVLSRIREEQVRQGGRP